MPRTPVSDDGASFLQRTLAQLRSADGARPRDVDVPKIPGSLRLYQVTAWITGVMLLLLVAEMIVKYGVGYSLYAFSGYGPLAFVPYDPTGRITPPGGIDLSTGILIAHGWLYVLYLFADFRLWSLMRMPFTKFVQIALGGVIPFMSFIVEVIITRQVRAFLASRGKAAAHQPAGSNAEATH